MKVWVVSGDYPTEENPSLGMFVRDQVEALRGAGHQVHVLHAEALSLRPVANAARPRVETVLRMAGRAPAEAGAPVDPDALAAVEALEAPAQRGPWDRAKAFGAATARGLLGTARVLHDQAGNTVAISQLLVEMGRLAGRDGAPDVVHAHNVFPGGIAAVQWASRRRVPCVVTEHISAYLRHQYSAVELAAAVKVLDAAAAVIAVSAAQAEALPIPTDRVLVVPNVVPTGDFALREESARTGGAVLSLGRLWPHKRMDLLLRAYAELPAELRARHPLRIVGSGPERDHLAKLAATLRLDPGVLVGQRSRAEVVDEMRGAAVAVSTSEVETFGITLIEALASGVPFVATDSGGPRDIAGPGLGAVVPSDDPMELAAAIEEVLTAPATDAMDAARRDVAVARFGPEPVAARLEEIYRSLGAGG